MAKKVITLDNIAKLIGNKLRKEQVVLRRKVCCGSRTGEDTYLVCDTGIPDSVVVTSIASGALVSVVPNAVFTVNCILTRDILSDFDSENPFMTIDDIRGNKLMYRDTVVREEDLSGLTYKLD